VRISGVRRGYGDGVTNSSASHYLRDLAPLMLGRAQEAKAEAERTADPFQRGRSMGLYEAVSLLVQQLDAFGLDRESVGLAGVDPDRDLL
jgi:hypothetical protein